MNRKGFTLIELLAVITIISLLAILTTTGVSKLVSDSRDKLYNVQIESIKAAAQSWGAENRDILPDDGQCVCIKLSYLQEYGLLDSKINNPKTNEPFDDINIKITSRRNSANKLITEYEVDSKDVDECTKIKNTIAERISGDGNYTPGDEYEINVSSDKTYVFNVLSSTTDTVDFIMKEDPTFVTPWGYPNTEGPIDIINTLKELTDNWDNINYETYTYHDTDTTGSHMEPITNAGYQNLIYQGNNIIIENYDRITVKYDFKLRTRLITKEEAKKLGCKENQASCPTWVNNTWTLSSNSDDKTSAYRIVDNKLLTTATTTNVYPIRPVITLSKSKIEN